MNKNQINSLIPFAYEALEKVGIAKDGKINKTYRGQISTFGAAVSMGSLLPAIAFFSEKGSASTDREKLMEAIWNVLQNAGFISGPCKSLMEYAQEAGDKKECIINAAIALKLSMNLYQLEKQENEE